MSWNGAHPKISKAAARALLPAKACRVCVYFARVYPDLAERWRRCRDTECHRCGVQRGKATAEQGTSDRLQLVMFR